MFSSWWMRNRVCVIFTKKTHFSIFHTFTHFPSSMSKNVKNKNKKTKRKHETLKNLKCSTCAAFSKASACERSPTKQYLWRHFLLFSRRTFAGARFAEPSTGNIWHPFIFWLDWATFLYVTISLDVSNLAANTSVRVLLS